MNMHAHPASLTPRSRVARRTVLNAGSGPRASRRNADIFPATGWREVRIDIDPAVAPDVTGSITDMRPHFTDASFDAIFSSHCLEHLADHEVPPTLAEFRRVLRNDGFALLTCPDLETVARLLLSHGPDHVVYESAAGPITPMDMMFGHRRSIEDGRHHMGHRCGLTADRLGGLLTRAGFAEALVARSACDLWALALMPGADRDNTLAQLRGAGLSAFSGAV